MKVIGLNTLQTNISYIKIYIHLQYSQKYSFGDILRKFDVYWTRLLNSACLLNSTPKSVYFMLYFKYFVVDKIASLSHWIPW